MWSWMLSSVPQSVALIALVSLVITLFLATRKRGLKLPPGPRGLPIIGFLPFLSVTEPHLQLEQMRKKYGNVFGMYMGSKYFLILNDIQSTREAFNRDDYTPRPEGSFQVSEDFLIFGGTYGQHWIDHRKLAMRAIRDLAVNSNVFQDEIMKQIYLALDQLDEERSENMDGEVDLREITENAIVAMTCSMVCGKTYPPDHKVTKVIMRFLKAFAEYGTAFSIDTYLPWLKPILYYTVPEKTEKKKAFKDMENILWSEIDSHEKNPVDEPNDYIYYYLEESCKPNMEKRFKRGDMNGGAQALLFTASDTTRAAFEWFLLCMAKYSEVQDKVYQEIRNHLGSSGIPDYDQRDETPLTEACILETLRYRTLGPINPLHGSAKRVTSFQGYDIPAESVIISNLWSIHNDPLNWENPNEFDPNRFLSTDGKIAEIPECFVPFGTGKRICIGSKLALKEMYMLGICLLQRFQVLPSKGGVNLDGKMRVSWEPVSPKVRLIPRSD